ncbi:MAG: prepilin-type N-terminal cleavage/methylation domain-containing protein [Candidatus Sumerlaeia bacterium]|nr:prepilin-type N-terminal cleavage/methylation domain-containing protein [Candidatus Sumerlaeia bacterium]
MRSHPLHSPTRAFTLIELLIVVAIIAILAAIAVPNFLEAQVRSKVSRAHSDMRSLATALEAYRIDNPQYPPTPFVSQGDVGVLRVVPNHLSTPIAYVSTANFPDPFIMPNLGDFQGLTRTGEVVPYGPLAGYPLDPGGDAHAGKRYYYQCNMDYRRVSFHPDTDGAIAARNIQGMWVLASLGPGRQRMLVSHPTLLGHSVMLPYDPTNGTVSLGSITRTQKQTVGTYTGQ